MLILIKKHDFPMQVEDEHTFDGRKAKNNEIDSQHAAQDYFRPLGRLPACRDAMPGKGPGSCG